ncbi:DHA2 family methylenomycin A resistance protein-like MFS transporter [Paraburkholderia bannensis]|uniref:DHA2 family methylenomycin A resistance protein-like MFS transporter n=1 Tax=Paraburkholderia bannensis TaxID=765414 RepID=A0A7W9TXP7_9BURK|nr:MULTISPECIES: MFS transporter [Paraburkholderia]MBB3261571.1 DHA2 family methylenomycin A resistance protein-like MFS transporter [Paraburkholderia sp. WP4_3_2]MBB6102115.1 DHA2 family methylenomycin A resistance protein-like MFS transporter [Paraburkholderia bannensis]
MKPAHTTPPAAPHVRFTPALARIVGTVSVGFVVTQLDVTIVNIALVRIATDLHANVARLQWIVDAYTLAFAVLMLSGGVLGDRYGARRMYAVGLVVFALASLACGLAPNPALLIGARALQGAGAAAMLPNSLALLNEACRHERSLRPRAVGFWTAAGAISIAAGPVAGGLLIAAFGWRSIFLVNLPLCAAGLAATLAWVPAKQKHADTAANAASAQRPRSLDVRGQLLAVIALTAFTGAVIEWRPLGFTHWAIWGGLLLAVFAGVAFVAQEARTADPMLPLAMLRNRTFSAAVLFGICVNLTYYGTVFVLALFLQHARGLTPLQAGLAFIPLTGGFLISNIASGHLVSRFGTRLPMIGGALVAGLGYALLIPVDAGTPLVAMLAAFLLIPSGMGLAVPAMTTTVLSSVEPARAGTASALLNTARQAGGAVGVAAFGALTGGGAAAEVTGGLHADAGISGALLLIAACLAWTMRADSPHCAQAAPAEPRLKTSR